MRSSVSAANSPLCLTHPLLPCPRESFPVFVQILIRESATRCLALRIAPLADAPRFGTSPGMT